jgi:hypothetical protein
LGYIDPDNIDIDIGHEDVDVDIVDGMTITSSPARNLTTHSTTYSPAAMAKLRRFMNHHENAAYDVLRDPRTPDEPRDVPPVAAAGAGSVHSLGSFSNDGDDDPEEEEEDSPSKNDNDDDDDDDDRDPDYVPRYGRHDNDGDEDGDGDEEDVPPAGNDDDQEEDAVAKNFTMEGGIMGADDWVTETNVENYHDNGIVKSNINYDNDSDFADEKPPHVILPGNKCEEGQSFDFWWSAETKY